MRSHKNKINFFVDAAPLVERSVSGVGHSIAGLLGGLLTLPAFNDKFQVVLVIPKGTKKQIGKWKFTPLCRIKELPLRTRIINGMVKFRIIPKMDMLLGRGVYFFGNFRNWPLSEKSYSYTTIHDICFALYPQFVRPNNQKMLIKNVPRFISRADKVITVSEASRKEIIEYYKIPKDKVIAIYNGVDKREYTQVDKKSIEKVKKHYGLSGEYILFVGNIEPRKNLSKLLEAYSRLDPELLDRYSLLLIGGDGWLNDDIYAKITELVHKGLKIVKPRSYVSDTEVISLMCGATTLVHPAIHEGFGMPPVEAAAAGTPVVASDIPVLREVMHDAALYFDPDIIDDMVDKITMILSDEELRKKLIANANKIITKLTWEEAALSFCKHLLSDYRFLTGNKD